MKKRIQDFLDPIWLKPKSITVLSINTQSKLLNKIISNLILTAIAVKDNMIDCGIYGDKLNKKLSNIQTKYLSDF